MIKTLGRTQREPIQRLHCAFGPTNFSVAALVFLFFYNDGWIIDSIYSFLLNRYVGPAFRLSVLYCASVHGTLDIVCLFQDFWVKCKVLLIISPNSYEMLFPVLAETSQQSISNAYLYYCTGRSRGT